MRTFGETWRSWSWPRRIAAAAFIAYTAIHVGYAGVRKPLTDHLIIQTAPEVRPLQAYFRTGRPVALDPNNPRQSGPAYVFLMHSILRLSGGADPGHLDLAAPSDATVAAVSRCLYVAVVPSLVLAVWIAVATTVLIGSVFFVANIIPRQIVQRIIPVRLFGRWSGYTHLLPTELYNHYGFAMVGLVLLLAALWAIRPARIENVGGA